MGQPREKPYEFVSFPDTPLKRGEASGHHHFAVKKFSGTLTLRLVVCRPVQVASGFQDVLSLHTGEAVVALNASLRRRDGEKLILPGSSLKGAVRAIVEALSASCVRVVGWRARSALPHRLNPCSQVTQLCPACRLFGMSGGRRENYAGQVYVEDAVMVEGKVVVVRTPLLWTPARGRRGLPECYLTGREVKGRKFYYHGKQAKGPDARLAAGTDAIFETRFHFENLTGSELGLLMVALGQHPEKPFLLKVGAAKPVGLGSVKVQVMGIDLRGNIRKAGRASASVERIEGESLANKIREWVIQAEREGLLQAGALDEIRAILREENLSRLSPEGPY